MKVPYYYFTIARGTPVADSDYKKPENIQELVRSISILKAALPKMTHFDIPPTPENYAVWYEYSQGSILKLNAEIDQQILHKNPFSATLNHQLYMEHIAPQNDEILLNTQNDTHLLVQSLMNKIENMHSGTKNFSNKLETFQSMLSEKPNIDTLSNLVAGLLDESDKVTRSNDAMKTSLAEMGDKVETLKESMTLLNKVALTDQLTNIANRRAFDDMLRELLHLYGAENEVFCLLLLDIDHFKAFNDTFGHALGDKVLAYVAATMNNVIKGDDFVARFGGEEFVILLPGTDYAAGMVVAEHVREKVSERKLAANQGKTNMGHVTISIGLALVNNNDNETSLIERADKGLYLAKRSGRNRVVGEKEL